MSSLPVGAVVIDDGGRSEAVVAPMGFTVTAASVGDYRPRLDRRVTRSKARPGRSRDEKKRSSVSAMRHPWTARSHTRRAADQKPAAEERDSPSMMEGG